MTNKLLIALLALAGCDVEQPVEVVTEVGMCDGVLTDVPVLPGIHVPPDSDISHDINPPATGVHYWIWANWNRVYDSPPLSRGYWLHNTEHGGIALLYNCGGAADCPERDALAALAESMPDDPLCVAPLRNRFLVTADPLLPEGVRVAAIAWGHSYTASCYDEQSLRAFIDQHYGESTENTCAPGGYPDLPPQPEEPE